MKTGRTIALATSMLVGLLTITTSASAADTTAPSFSWLTGVWHAAFMGGQAEDVYQPVNNDEILSTFKLVVNGKVTRYEFRSIRQKEGKWTYQELAFGPELVPAAPVADRVLVSTDDSHINFDGLTFTRTGQNSMQVQLTIHAPDGQTRTLKIDYTRALQFNTP